MESIKNIDPAAGNENDDINLTPMLDVVFILLIFFIVTASFVRELGIDLSRSQHLSIPPQSSPSEVIVEIDAQSQMFVEGRIVDRPGLQSVIEWAEATVPGTKVVIRAHDQSSNKALVHVMDAARLAGVYNIAIAE